MFDFSKLCKEYEELSTPERSMLLTGKAVSVLAGLDRLNIPGVDPVHTLAGFILGAVTADGRINEQEYLLIYPALLHIFGNDFDYESVRKSFRADRDGRNAVRQYTRDMLGLLSLADEELRDDVIMLCLCVVSIDKKISLRERHYIRQLVKQG